MSLQLKRGNLAVPGTDKVVQGLHFRLVVWARSGSRDWRDRWHKLCKALGVSQEILQDMADGDVWGWETAYDVWGTPEALEALTSGVHKAVVRWEYAVVPMHQPGTSIGDEKRAMKHKPKPRAHNNFYGLDKQLQGHRERYQKALDEQCLPK